MPRRYLPRSAQDLVHWYERYISPIALISGFLVDNYILLKRVDLLQTNLILFSYLLVAALGIICINLIEEGRIRARWVISVAPLIPVVVQFAFGGLFSGYLALYSRSAGFAVSWIFVLAIAALLVANERFARLYVRFAFQMSLYFFVLFSFFTFFLPVVFKTIGPGLFLVSGITSLVALALFMRVLRALVPEIVKKERIKVVRSVAIIFLVFNVLYFTNVIPPLPLSLKESGIYHNVVKVGADYHLSKEVVPWLSELLSFSSTFHTSAGKTAYAYTAVFAPSGLSTDILHEWQLYDEDENEWVTKSVQRFPITGGRDGGYRGYSFKSDLVAGKWRVDVETQYGQLVGRINFVVDTSAEQVQLEELVR